jgi:hypothetical protein
MALEIHWSKRAEKQLDEIFITSKMDGAKLQQGILLKEFISY